MGIQPRRRWPTVVDMAMGTQPRRQWPMAHCPSQHSHGPIVLTPIPRLPAGRLTPPRGVPRP
eukprot:6375879-Pyramimonas_sp.AAC.1